MPYDAKRDERICSFDKIRSSRFINVLNIQKLPTWILRRQFWVSI